LRLLRRHVYGRLGHRPIGSIKRGELVRLLDEVADSSGARTADMVLAILRTIMRWHAVRNEDYTPVIVPGMRRQKPEEHERSRTLSDDELRRVWHAAAPATPYGALLRFLLLTGARRGEAAGMRWSELRQHQAADFDGMVWDLPAHRNKKTRKDLTRPLSRAALALLEARPRIDGSAFVFSVNGGHALTGFSEFKKGFDVTCGAHGWVVHDLRRTARTLLSRAGVNKDHAERMLGHVIGGVRRVYDKYEYLPEKKHAAEALAALIERIVDPQQNIVPIRAQ
jgi:integrase